MIKPATEPKRRWEAPTSLHVSKKVKSSERETITVYTTSTSVFRIQLVCAVLAQRPIVFNQIREDTENPGLTDPEIAFARLLALITNGSKLIINETATRLSFVPGVPTGGSVNLEVGEDVNLSWLIEGLLPLAPFCKEPIRVTLSGGITDSDEEIGINLLRSVSLRLLDKFGVVGATIDCHQRGFKPSGGGSVTFTCPIVRKHLIVPTDLDKTNLKILKVRGLAQSSRVNPQLANRLATKARADLEEFSTDVFISTDCRSSRTKDAGNSPGYSLTLWCEVVDPKLAEVNHVDKLPITSVVGTAGGYKDDDDSPERLGTRVAKSMLKQISLMGSVDIYNQSLVLMLMATCPEEAIRCNMGRELSKHAIGTLRAIKQFLSVRFSIVTDRETGLVMVTCIGNGIGNFARRVT